MKTRKLTSSVNIAWLPTASLELCVTDGFSMASRKRASDLC